MKTTFRKNIIAKKIVRCICLMLAAVMCLSSNVYAAKKPSAAKVKNAYQKYYSKHYVNNGYRQLRKKSYDFNRDGVKEMFVSYEAGVRLAYDFYTYSNGKVVRMHKTFFGGNGISAMKGKKYIVVSSSQSSSEAYETVYRIKGKKMVKVTEYKYLNGKYYKNGKKIASSTYTSFYKQQKSIY